MYAVGKSKYGKKTTPENYQAIRDRALCIDERKGYFNFFKLAWHVLERVPLHTAYYNEYIAGRLQRQAERIARGDPRVVDEMFAMPPRTGKSLLLTVFFNAWCWTRWPWMKFITCSYSDRLAKQHSGLTKKIVQSKWFLQRWGDEVEVYISGDPVIVGGCRIDKDTEGEFTTTMGGRRFASSVGGTVTGSGADIIIGDDLTSIKQGRSKAQREASVHFYRETLYNRLDNPSVGVRLLMQQRIHHGDVLGVELKDNAEMYHRTIVPAEVTNKVMPQPSFLASYYKDGSFDSKRFPKKELERFKSVLTTYNEQYLQDPKASGTDIWKKEWFFEWDWNDLMERLRLDGIEPVWHFEFDGAYTKNKNNAANVCMAYLVYNNRAYVRAIFREWLTFTELLPALKAFLLVNGYSKRSEVRIEPKANGKDLIPALVDWSGVNAMESYNPYTDKVTAASFVSPIIKAGRVGFLNSIDTKDFFAEVEAFGPDADFADQIDVVTMICNNGLDGRVEGVLASG